METKDYPKEILIDLLNTYSCQKCQKDFKTKEDLRVVLEVEPLCNNCKRFGEAKNG